MGSRSRCGRYRWRGWRSRGVGLVGLVLAFEETLSGGCAEERTQAADDEGYAEPHLGPEHLPCMCCCEDGEEPGENDRCGEIRDVFPEVHLAQVLLELRHAEGCSSLMGVQRRFGTVTGSKRLDANQEGCEVREKSMFMRVVGPGEGQSESRHKPSSQEIGRL
jgi:hypothetical protein